MSVVSLPPLKTLLSRREFSTVAGVVGLALPAPLAAQTPKKAVKVGFARTGAKRAGRTAITGSIKSEAEKRGLDLTFSDAQGKQENQIRAVRSFITQGVNVIVIAPIVVAGRGVARGLAWALALVRGAGARGL
jgi:ABC-type sugar transport system substrate-binding protein